MILIIGSSGYVGIALCEYLNSIEIPYLTTTLRYPFDKINFRYLLLKNNIDVVINCAGYTGKPNIDACEKIEFKQECLFANSFMPAAIADVCQEISIKLVHVSSGCLYADPLCDNGQVPFKEFNENDSPNFNFDSGICSWYSGTKAHGERMLELYNNVAIARLRLPFDDKANPKNYIQKLIQYPKLLNVTNSISYLDEFVAALYQLSTDPLAFNHYGIFNLTQPGYITTRKIVELLQKYNLTGDKEWFASIDDFNANVKTKRSNCALNATKAIKNGIKLTPIFDSIEQAIDKYFHNTKK